MFKLEMQNADYEFGLLGVHYVSLNQISFNVVDEGDKQDITKIKACEYFMLRAFHRNIQTINKTLY